MASLPNLDGIRAIAVSLVVVSHLLLQLAGGEDLAGYSFHAMGHVGVAIFFVHTTLVLMASLERHGSAAIPFYVRRFFRIYPLAIAVVVLIALLQLAANLPIDIGKFLSNLFLVQNITGHDPTPHPLWSLPYEVQMYAVLPALYQITKTRHPTTWTGLLYVGSVLLILALEPASLGYRLLRFAPCFLSGLLAFALSKRIQTKTSPLVFFGLVLALGVLGVPMLVAAGLPEIPLMWILCLALGLTIPTCRQLRNERLARGAKLIATYSYGIYITHVFALGAIDGLMPGPAIVQWAAMLILLPGLAYICYHGIEKHGIALGAYLADRCAVDLGHDGVRGTAAADQTGHL